MMTPICPRFLNMINDFVLLRFRARTPEELSAIEVIYLFIYYLLFISARSNRRRNCDRVTAVVDCAFVSRQAVAPPFAL